MDPTQLWNTLLVWPIESALITLADVTASGGLATILFTLIVRTALLPLGLMQARSMKAMARLQPQLREIQKRYAGDRQRVSQEQMRLYKEAGVNPLAGCLPLALQMPIWIALYSALWNLSKGEQAVEAFQAGFLWLPTLGEPDPYFIMGVLTAASQWVVQRMATLPSADPQQQQMARIMEFMPIMFLFFAMQVPSGLTLYWVVANLYSIVQQYFTTGWGTLPFLGTTAVPALEPAAVAASTEPRQQPRARRRTGSPARKRRR